MSVLRRLIREADFNGVAEYVSRRLSLSLSPKDVSDVIGIQLYCPSIGDGSMSGVGGWSEATWLTWFKVQLCKLERIPCGCREAPPVHFKVAMHVFFIYLEETPEMLVKLLAGDSSVPTDLGLARSKIFRTQLLPEPIDRTAARCSGPNPSGHFSTPILVNPPDPALVGQWGQAIGESAPKEQANEERTDG